MINSCMCVYFCLSFSLHFLWTVFIFCTIIVYSLFSTNMFQITNMTHARIQKKIVRRGPTLTTFFLLISGERIQIQLKAGHHRPAIKMAFRWRADDGLTLNADLVALWLFRGSGPVLLRNSGSIVL